MMPNRDGRFKATIIAHGISDTGSNNLATFLCQFGLIEELVNGDWQPLQENIDMESTSFFQINGFFYLEKKDGSINIFTIDKLKESLGWDGVDPRWLQDEDLIGKVVQLTLSYDTYQGKERLKVNFIDPEESTDFGVKRSDSAECKAINTRLGSKLRALSGGKAKPAPKPKTSRPKPPGAKKPTATNDEAWEAFVKTTPETEQDAQEQAWFNLLEATHPGKDSEKYTAKEWYDVLVVAQNINSSSRLPSGDDIPF